MIRRQRHNLWATAGLRPTSEGPSTRHPRPPLRRASRLWCLACCRSSVRKFGSVTVGVASAAAIARPPCTYANSGLPSIPRRAPQAPYARPRGTPARSQMRGCLRLQWRALGKTTLQSLFVTGPPPALRRKASERAGLKAPPAAHGASAGPRPVREPHPPPPLPARTPAWPGPRAVCRPQLTLTVPVAPGRMSCGGRTNHSCLHYLTIRFIEGRVCFLICEGFESASPARSACLMPILLTLQRFNTPLRLQAWALGRASNKAQRHARSAAPRSASSRGGGKRRDSALPFLLASPRLPILATRLFSREWPGAAPACHLHLSTVLQACTLYLDTHHAFAPFPC
jgi:hypothetical protein